MTKVTCDKCKKEFKIKAKTKKYKKGIEELYFKCPHCKEKYTAFYIDKEGKELQKKIKAERLKYYNTRDKETLNKIKNMQLMLKIKMNNLKAKMEGTQ